MAPRDRSINYIEFAVTDLSKSKTFYGQAFGWTFTDFGPSYTEFSDGTMTGGFHTQEAPHPQGGPLIVLYGDDLDAMMTAIQAAGGRITKPVFDFPGGRRFHFTDLDGYELAVWTSASDA